MLVFPNCKINLGLHVVNKRPDGYHSIETVFYPLNWRDALEIIDNEDQETPFTFAQSGITITGPGENNLIFKAWKIVNEAGKCPPVKVHLHKNIPMGAGLGGGSSNAVCFINTMDRKFKLGLSEAQKMAFAARLGSDCAFFVKNQPAYATGKGDELSPIQLDLSSYYILAVHPGIHSDTTDAYAALVPGKPARDLRSLVKKNPGDWRDLLVNDFEPSVFKRHPEIKALKESLYASGALYASMSGSGSAVFGIFDHAPEIRFPGHYSCCLQKPATGIL